ncbi:MAG TPA: glutaminase A [Pseudonocardia sp.]
MVADPVSDLLARIHDEILTATGGRVASYIPELAGADPDVCAVALATLDGVLYEIGEVRHPFTIQSVSKPFVLALAIQDRGLDAVLSAVGVEPTGDPFNAVTLEPHTGRPLNPMVNAGAIVTSNLVDGQDPTSRIERITEGLSAFAARPLSLDERVLASELATADRNRAIAYLMRSMGSLDVEVEAALAVYCAQCSLTVTARDLAVMSATLANGGRNPVTGQVVIDAQVVTHVLSMMLTCGLYDFSGEWVLRTGLPAKSGVSGGIAVALPGQFGIGTYSPRLDHQGNSVRGIAACERLSERFGLHVMRPPATDSAPIRRRIDGGEIRSRRHRPRRERTVLADQARAIVVYELQGVITFRQAELIARRAASETSRWLIFDAARVSRLDPASERLLADAIGRLAATGVQPLLSGRWSQGFLPFVERYPSAADAVERCEDALVADAGLSGPVEDIPLEENDLCRALCAADLEVLAKALDTRHYQPGQVVGPERGPGEALMFITRGRVAIEHENAEPDPATGLLSPRIAARSAGTAVGSLAVAAPETTPTRLTAETEVAMLVLTDTALDRLTSDHPAVAAAVLRATTEAIAAECRWLAAVNLALSR